MDKEYRVVLNVGGVKHVTYKHTLKKIPATRLSRLTTSSANYDSATCEYFFDRHPNVFANILNYYRTGKLHYPQDICGSLFEEELTYWGLDANQVEPCCWLNYTKHRATQEVLQQLDEDQTQSDVAPNSRDVYASFGYEDDFLNDSLSSWQKFKPLLWSLVDKPRSGRLAKYLGIVSVSMLVLAVVAFCMKTHHLFRVASQVNRTNTSTMQTETIVVQIIYFFPFHITTRGHPLLVYFELLANVWFAFEIIVRLVSCPSLCTYFTTATNIIDVTATGTFFVDFYLKRSGSSWSDKLEFISIIRILRLIKLTQHNTGLKVLAHTFRASARELLMLNFFLFLAIVTFAALVYYAEKTAVNPHNVFHSIPDGLWWAVVTMTTVGYGDMVPNTTMGRFIGSFCAILGGMAIALPVPVIVSNFELYYTHTQAKQKMPKSKRIDDHHRQIHNNSALLMAVTNSAVR